MNLYIYTVCGIITDIKKITIVTIIFLAELCTIPFSESFSILLAEPITWHISKLEDGLLIIVAAEATCWYGMHILRGVTHHLIVTHQTTIAHCYFTIVPGDPEPSGIGRHQWFRQIKRKTCYILSISHYRHNSHEYLIQFWQTSLKIWTGQILAFLIVTPARSSDC